MKVELVLATKDEVKLVHDLQYRAFLPLYEKYQDDETSPVKEPIEKTKDRIVEDVSDFYIICTDGINVGGVRVTKKKRKDENNQEQIVENVNFISPLFILPEYQNRGIGQNVIKLLFDKYVDIAEWDLYTIKEEKGNCHLYEKCGFIKTGNEKIVNDKMTLVKYEKSMAPVRKLGIKDSN